MFEQSGFDAATLDRIAERAGLTKGAIYSNFGGKDELFQAVISDRVAARISTAVASATSRESDGLRSVGDALSRISSRDPGWHTAFLEYWVRAQRNSNLSPLFRAGRTAVQEEVADSVRRFAEGGGDELALSPERLAVVILALSNGLAIEASAGGGDPELFGDALACLVARRPAGHRR